MTNPTNPWHAHVYYDMESWDTAQLVHQQLSDMVVTGTCAGLVLVGQMYDRGVGPHLQPQFEIQFYESAVPRITEILKATGLTSLIHPLTDDDLADHTTLAQWLGSHCHWMCPYSIRRDTIRGFRGSAKKNFERYD